MNEAEILNELRAAYRLKEHYKELVNKEMRETDRLMSNGQTKYWEHYEESEASLAVLIKKHLE